MQAKFTSFTSAQKIKSLRRQAGLTQQQFAEQLGVSRGYLGDIESGRSAPSRHFLTSLMTHFDVKIDWVLGDQINEVEQDYADVDRVALMKAWIDEVSGRGVKDRHWLEKQFEIAFPQFLTWLQDRPKKL